MRSWRASLALFLLLASGAAAEIGTVTQAAGEARLLRGTTWYRLPVGTRIEPADIVDAAERAQVQIEFAVGALASLVGPGALYIAASPARDAPLAAALTGGWLKVVARPPGARIRAPVFDMATVDGTFVVHAGSTETSLFAETGTARLIEVAPNGADRTTRDAKHGEYWARAAGAGFTTAGSAPRSFVGAMPRHFLDPLPALAARTQAGPALTPVGEITYAEASPWLAGRDRAAFEKRFVRRLQDPAFRKAALPDLAQHPSWDRIVHPDKYVPKVNPAP